MIHLGDTSPAMATVVSPGWFRGLALFAPALVVDLDDLVGEVVSAGIDGDGFVVGVIEDGEQCVEDDNLPGRKRTGIEGG